MVKVFEYEADILVTGMLSDACIVEIAVADAADLAGDEELPVAPTREKTRKMLCVFATR